MALPQAGVELVTSGINDYLKNLGSASDASNRLFDTLDDGAKRTSSFSEIATGALREVGAVAVNALGQAAGAAVGFFQDSVKEAQSFQSGLATFGSVAGQTLEQYGLDLDDVKKKALQLGIDTAYSAQESLLAMTELAKGGVDLQSVMTDATDATLNLAAAGELELGQAAEIVAKQLGVWGETGVTAARVTDLLSQAANASSSDVEELGLGMANVGGIAKTLGVSFEETITALAFLAPNFSSSSTAATSLRVALQSLQPKTKKAKETMMALGLITEDGTNKFYDASGSMKNLSEVAQILQDAFKGLTDAEKAEAFANIAGQDGMVALAAFVNGGSAALDNMTKSMQLAGSAAEQAKIRNQTFDFALQQLTGSFETLKIVIGGPIINVLTRLLNDYITPLVNKILVFAQSILDAENPIAALGQAIDTVIPGFSTFASTVANFTTTTFIPQLQGIADTVSSVVGPAIANLASTIMPRLSESLNNVKVGAGVVKSWIESNWPGISATLQSGLDGFRSYVDTKWTQLEPAITTSLTNIKTWVTSQWPAVETNLKSALDNVVKWVQSNWPNLEFQVTSIIDNIVNHATVELPKISQGFGPLMESIKRLAASFGGVMQAIGSRVAPVIDKLGAAFVKSAPYIQQISTELNKLAVTVLPGLAAIVAVVVGVVLGLVNAIIYGVATALPFLTMAVAGVVTAITEFITGFINLVVGLGTAIYDAATGNFASAWQVIQDTVGNTVLAIISTLGGLAQAALGIVAGLVSAIVGFFYGLYITLVGGSIIPDMIMAIIQWFAMLPGQLLSLVTQMVTGLIGYISANLGTWMATLLAWGTAAWNWLAVAIPQVIAQLGIWGTTLLNYLSANLPTWIANLLLWSNQLWEFVKNAIPPLIAQLVTFLTMVKSWATDIVLPLLIAQATAWATSLYEWVTKELIPGIKPKLTEFLTTTIARLVEMGKEFAKQAVKMGDAIIDGMVDAIKSGASSVVSAIINVVTAAIQAAMNALGAHSPSKVFADIGGMAMEGFKQGIESNSKEPSVAAIAAARKTIDAVLGALKGVEGHGISNEITEVLESWSKTVGSLSDLFDNLEKLAGFKKFNSESFRKAVVEGTAGVLNGLREAANYISAQFKAYNAKQLDAMEVRGTVQELLDNWINSVGSIAGMIDNLKSIFSFGKRKNLDAFLDSVRTGTGALIDALRAAAQIVVEKFGAANLGMPTISDEIQTMLDNWTGLIQTITDALTNIKKLWSFGKSNTQGLKESVYDAVIKIMEAMNAVQQAVTDSKPAQTASNMMQSALNQSLASSDIQVKVPQISMTMGQDTGVAIIDGMEGAIRKSGVRVANALVDVVTTAIDAAKKALGIASPSKVFFEVGMNTTKGLGLGIERGGYQVVDVMTETLGRMVNAIPGVGRGDTIAPPMSGQQIAQNSVTNNSTSRSFTYAPTYNTAPPQTVDMAIANAMAGSFA